MRSTSLCPQSLACALFAALGLVSPAQSWSAQPIGAGPPEDSSQALRYDREYPVMHYGDPATHNAVARLQTRLDRGEVKLTFEPKHGYLESLLDALGIDRSSQTLVYSKTSLQTGSIRAATPRAIYFNDDAYVAWVQGSDLLELGAMDTERGQVFYTLPNSQGEATRLQRETLRCLSCHDTYSLSGGGVPRFLIMSSYVNTLGDQIVHEGSILPTDQTELKYRWGGWYVTGQHGAQVHLGNMHIRQAQQLLDLESLRRGNLDSLDGLFNTQPYLTNKSDIVALLVMQHQAYIQNLITRVNFETRTVLAKDKEQTLKLASRPELKEDLDALVDAMLFVDAAPLTDRIVGNAGFDVWFESQGPRDSKGRSLRELDLTKRLFKYPLSYLIYAPAFDALPQPALNYVYERFAAVLSERDQGAAYAHLSSADRRVIIEILTATKPGFAQASRR